jgi:ketosteroid isomerase-like protein
MLDRERAWKLAREWVDAWNAHELEEILSHYSDDVVLVSPVAVERLGDPSGTVRGKAALREYFALALRAYPALHFDLRDVMWGIDAVVLYYANQRGSMTAEVMELAEDGRVRRVVATYSG